MFFEFEPTDLAQEPVVSRTVLYTHARARTQIDQFQSNGRRENFEEETKSILYIYIYIFGKDFEFRTG